MKTEAMAKDLSTEEIIALNRLTVIARLVGGAAHDLNNALQIINGSSDVLVTSPEATAAGRTVQRIQEQTARAGDIVHTLMAFSRERDEAPHAVSLKKVVEQALALRRFALRRSGITVHWAAAAAEEGLVNGHPPRLRQAVLNLVINAEQALAGRSDARLDVSVTNAASELIFALRDNGPGIDPDVSDHIFEPFATSRPVPDATGLGLTAARIIAHAHGGDVSLTSSGEGCVATLHLPMA